MVRDAALVGFARSGDRDFESSGGAGLDRQPIAARLAEDEARVGGRARRELLDGLRWPGDDEPPRSLAEQGGLRIALEALDEGAEVDLGAQASGGATLGERAGEAALG